MLGRLIGQYRIVHLLGEGGMGAVYEAVHESIGQRAAIKVLHPRVIATPEIVRRFFNEARALAIVKHPGLVKIFDFGQAAPDQTAGRRSSATAPGTTFLLEPAPDLSRARWCRAGTGRGRRGCRDLHLTIDGDGSVGIGTTAPQSTLQVSGNYIQIPTDREANGPPNPSHCTNASHVGRMIVLGGGSEQYVGLWVCLISGDGSTKWRKMMNMM